ncbi:hypothetical protein WP1_145 [Pseudomonas phage WP1]
MRLPWQKFEQYGQSEPRYWARIFSVLMQMDWIRPPSGGLFLVRRTLI